MGVPTRTAIRLTLSTLAVAALLGAPLAEAASRAGSAHRSAPAPRGGASARASAAPRSAVPRSTASGSRTAVAPRGTAGRGTVSPRGTASGTARYGYGSYGYPSYPYYPYYPYYPSYGWPYWGWYGDWGYGWPYYGFSIGASYGTDYVYGSYPAPPTGPAVVETDVSPSKAEVILDGTPSGLAKDFNGTWDELRIEPGHHTITFRKEGYRSLTVEFDAVPGGRYVFDQQLARGEGEDRIQRPSEAPAPAPPAAPAGVAKGFLRIRVLPEDAAIYLDGGYLGTGLELGSLHGALAVAQGEHVVEVARPGYKSETRTLLVGSDGHALLDLTLEKSGP